jgi:hypothetical protein
MISGSWRKPPRASSSCMPPARPKRPRLRPCSTGRSTPYTRGLLASAPRSPAPPRRGSPRSPATVPSSREEIAGCRFAPRCAFATGPLPARGARSPRCRAAASTPVAATLSRTVRWRSQRCARSFPPTMLPAICGRRRRSPKRREDRETGATIDRGPVVARRAKIASKAGFRGRAGPCVFFMLFRWR